MTARPQLLLPTPGPWTTLGGRVWICTVGNNWNDPSIWSAVPVADGQSYPCGDKRADAALIAEAPALRAAVIDLMGYLMRHPAAKDPGSPLHASCVAARETVKRTNVYDTWRVK